MAGAGMNDGDLAVSWRSRPALPRSQCGRPIWISTAIRCSTPAPLVRLRSPDRLNGASPHTLADEAKLAHDRAKGGRA